MILFQNLLFHYLKEIITITFFVLIISRFKIKFTSDWIDQNLWRIVSLQETLDNKICGASFSLVSIVHMKTELIHVLEPKKFNNCNFSFTSKRFVFFSYFDFAPRDFFITQLSLDLHKTHLRKAVFIIIIVCRIYVFCVFINKMLHTP